MGTCVLSILSTSRSFSALSIFVSENAIFKMLLTSQNLACNLKTAGHRAKGKAIFDSGHY